MVEQEAPAERAAPQDAAATEHGHGHGTKAIKAAFFANLSIAIAKFAGWLVTGASSMLAEAIHSLADTGNQGLLILGQRTSARPATKEHPFGYGRDRYFWAFVVALVLFSVGGLFAINEGAEKLRHPHEISSPAWAIGILCLGIVLEGFSFMTAVRESNRIRRQASWTEFVRHSKSPELPVVLLEDLGALVGLVLALVGVILATVTKNSMWDALGTLSIGVLLVLIAVVLAIEMKSLLIGESAGKKQLQSIRQAMGSAPNVLGVIHMKTQHLGPEELLLAAKVEFSHELSVRELADAIDTLEARVREAVPIVTQIYIEPDVFREPSE